MITGLVVPEPGWPAPGRSLRAQPYDQVNGIVCGGFRRPSAVPATGRARWMPWLH